MFVSVGSGTSAFIYLALTSYIYIYIYKYIYIHIYIYILYIYIYIVIYHFECCFQVAWLLHLIPKMFKWLSFPSFPIFQVQRGRCKTEINKMFWICFQNYQRWWITEKFFWTMFCTIKRDMKLVLVPFPFVYP